MFLVGNGLGLALALYKCQAMGLLPTRPSDWLAFVTPPQVSPGSWGHPAGSGVLGSDTGIPRSPLPVSHLLAANGIHWGGPDLVTPCAHPPIKAMAGW